MQSWFQFCDSKVAAIEKVWNQKLDKSEPEPAAAKPEEEDHEQTIEAMLDKLASSGRLQRSPSQENRPPPLNRADSLETNLKQAEEA